MGQEVFMATQASTVTLRGRPIAWSPEPNSAVMRLQIFRHGPGGTSIFASVEGDSGFAAEG